MLSLLSLIWENKGLIGSVLAVATPIVGRAYYALKNDGGIVGMVHAIVFGNNAPKQK